MEKTLARMALREVDVASLPGVGPQTALVFVEAGISTVGEVAEAGIEGLVEVPGVGAKTAERLLAGAHEALEAATDEDDTSAEAVPPSLEASPVASDERGTAEDREASAVLASLVMDSAEAESEESSEPEAPQD